MTAAFVSLATATAALLGIVAVILGGARLIGNRLLRGRLGVLGRTDAAKMHLRITETLALDPRRRLHLLNCDGHAVLLLTGGPSDVMLPLGGAPEGAE